MKLMNKYINETLNILETVLRHKTNTEIFTKEPILTLNKLTKYL